MTAAAAVLRRSETGPLPATVIVAGLDPGLKGAIAIVEVEPRWKIITLKSWDVRKRSGKARTLAYAAILDAVGERLEPGTMVVTEAVGARPNQGLSSTWGFGYATGLAEAIVRDRGCKLHKVSPAKWKRHLGLIGKAKRASVERANLLAPSWALRQKDHDTAEALLLAFWWSLAQAHQVLKPGEKQLWGLLQ